MRVRYIAFQFTQSRPVTGFNSRYAGKIHLLAVLLSSIFFAWFNSRYAGKIHRLVLL